MAIQKQALLRLGLLMLTLLCASGGDPRSAAAAAEQAKPALTPEESAAAQEALVAWFECEECTDKELERVTKYGDAVVPSLAATLEGGLSASKREEVRQHLRDSYRDLAAYAKEHRDQSFKTSEQEYVDRYLGNTDSLYRVRAAEALGRIGTPAARAALKRAQAIGSLRPDVRRAIDAALNAR